ncbi:MAG: 23S rRNA (uracil(1939)-C(5))-methyltransferase RlmD [Cyanobacteria bacterium J06639_18]
MTETKWRQGELIEVEIVDLNDTGDGVAKKDGRVVFVADTVPGDRIITRLLHVKSKYAHGKLQEIRQPSPNRIRPSCIVADKCGGCQWQHIDYQLQLEAKRNRVIQALERIGGFANPPVTPVLKAPKALGYRNKATYPVGISGNGKFIAGYYQKSSHKLINLNHCPIQDVRLEPLLKRVKQDIERRGWKPYNEKLHQGEIRHISFRIGRRTGEILLTIVAKQLNIPGIEEQAQEWLDHYPPLVGVMLNQNGERTNVIFGSDSRCIAGRPYLREKFAGLEFQIQAETFFQVYTETAESLLQIIQSELNLQGNELLLDTYCGIGTLTLPLAKQVGQAVGLEMQVKAVEQAKLNARINNVDNVTFYAGKVEELLPKMDLTPDIVLLDPPRKGCDPQVIETLLMSKPERIVYVSCKASTLARDLKLLCQNKVYNITRVVPADFFPQTAHVEAAAFAVLSQIDVGSKSFTKKSNLKFVA